MKSYTAEKQTQIGSRFSDTSKLPSNFEEDKPAGAYQIKFRQFKKALDATGWTTSFTPIDQDRAAIYLLQGKSATESHPKRTALGYIMEGKVEQAVNDSKLWDLITFLPGGGKQQLIDMDKLKQVFSTYTAEFSK